MFKYFRFSCLFLITAYPCLTHAEISKTTIYQFSERKFGNTEVPVEITWPTSGKKPYPVIISQHGSERDGKTFIGGIGKTDEYTKRLIRKASARGYAVFAIDAFYKKGVGANDKKQFPQASAYAEQLRDRIGEIADLDIGNIFYTGFSFGGRSVVDELPKRAGIVKWRALAAAEPDCNTFWAPSLSQTPMLIMKGQESHYPPKPCEIMANLYRKSGYEISVKIFPKSNHYFSHNGRIVKGKAYNGCSDDPVIIYNLREFKTASGVSVSLDELRKGKCFTPTGGSGKTREDLDAAIETALDFFDKHRTP
jgi:dienelactone hydrolase